MSEFNEYCIICYDEYESNRSRFGLGVGHVIGLSTIEDFVMWTFLFGHKSLDYAFIANQLHSKMTAEQVSRKVDWVTDVPGKAADQNIHWLPVKTLVTHTNAIADKVTDPIAREWLRNTPVHVIDGSGIEVKRPKDFLEAKVCHCWFKSEFHSRFFNVCSLKGFTEYVSELDRGHKSDDKATDDSKVRESHDAYYRFAPDADAEQRRLAQVRKGPGGTVGYLAIIMGDQAYVSIEPWGGCDILCTRSCEDHDGWAKTKNKAYVRVSSGVSKARSVVERIFGRLARDCPFVTGPIYYSQIELAHKFVKIYLSQYNRRILAGEDLFVRTNASSLKTVDNTDDDA